MGLDNTAAQVLCGVKSIGADFGATLMIGRQWLLAAPQLVAKVAQLQGTTVPPIAAVEPFAEPFFEMLGARQVDSLDFSPFEGATVQHDLNQPIPPDLRARYDLVFDGGSLEHVFNFPQALKNCMEMVRPGGLFVQVSNANNFMGHGFWQISPELMYRSMSRANGYQVIAVMLRDEERGIVNRIGVELEIIEDGTAGIRHGLRRACRNLQCQSVDRFCDRRPKTLDENRIIQ